MILAKKTIILLYTCKGDSLSKSNYPQSASKVKRTASQFKAKAPLSQQCYGIRTGASNLVTDNIFILPITEPKGF